METKTIRCFGDAGGFCRGKVYLVVLLTTFNIYKFYTYNGDDIP